MSRQAEGPERPAGEETSAGLSSFRHEHIQAALRREERVAVAELAQALEVSEETIRRDLRQLEREGHLRRVYGGAVRPPQVVDPPIVERRHLNLQAKARIARLAQRFVTEDMAVFLDTGTSTLALAGQLARMKKLSVFTNSLDIARDLAQAKVRRVVMVCGDVRTDDNAVVGYRAVQFVREHLFDIAFMGIVGIDLDYGFMDYSDDEAMLRRALAERAKQAVVLADHSKFGRRGLITTFGFDAVDRVVTDGPAPPDFARRFREAGTEIVHD